jgi:phosphodiesterase/alkaline phosphatase D-like protein
VAYVWDDHDFGPNDAAGDSPSREAAQTTYRRLVPHYPLPAGEGSEPIYQAFTMGRVRFILTDLRSERSPNGDVDGPAKTMLGAEQRNWLEAELLRSSREHALVVLVSSVPWIADVEAGADHWGGFATERQELAGFLAEHGIDNLAMVAGDAHMLAIDDGSNSAYDAAGATGFPVMHAGALDRPGSYKGGPYSEGAHPGGGQFATMDVEDDGSTITVTWRGLDWQGNELLGYSFSIIGETP